MKILITGANGFIGSFIAEEAVKRGYEVWAGVRLTSDLAYLNGLDLHLIDLNYAHPLQLVQQLLDHKKQHGAWDIIVHNAGVTKANNRADFDRINFGYTKAFIDALEEVHIIPRQFIYMSSLSAWGAGDEHSDAPIRLTDAPRPNTLYGVSKLRAEQYIQNLDHFPYVFLRSTGVYGPRERDYFVMLQTIQRGFDPAMGCKPQYLTFIYVLDLVAAIFAAIDKGVVRKAYFVSDTKTYTNAEYSEIVKQALGKRFALKLPVPLPLVKAIAYTLDTVCGWFGKSPTLNRDKYKLISAHNWRCETEALVHDLDFQPQYYLEDGVRASIEWYKQEGWLK